jgi:hypothetical protein
VSLRTRHAAHEIYRSACAEAADLESLAVDVEHLVLAVALRESALAEYLDPDDVRGRILARERDALASLGISLESVRDEIGEDAWAGECDRPEAPEAKRLLAQAARRRRHVTADDMLAVLVHESNTARRFLFELDVPIGTLQSRLRR